MSSDEEQGEHRETTAEEVAELLKNASSDHHSRIWYGGSTSTISVAEITAKLPVSGNVLTMRLKYSPMQVVYRVI